MTQFWTYRQIWCSGGWWKKTDERNLGIQNNCVKQSKLSTCPRPLHEVEINLVFKSLYFWVSLLQHLTNPHGMWYSTEFCNQRVWEMKEFIKICTFPPIGLLCTWINVFFFPALQLVGENCWSHVFSYWLWKTHVENADLDYLYFL